MNNLPPLTEAAGTADVPWSPTWSNFFTQIIKCLPWNQAYSYKFDFDFPNIAAGNESASSVFSIPGITVGDSVSVTPMNNQVGVIFTGAVTAQDSVVVYAKNFSTGAVNPASNTFRIIVIQN